MKINKIFLIDDDPVVNFLHSSIIKNTFPTLTMEIFEDPQLAIKELVINSLKPDLIFLDINMPIIDGWQFLKLLRENNIDTKVVIITSSIADSDKLHASTYDQIIDFQRKPFSRQSMKNLFNRISK